MCATCSFRKRPLLQHPSKIGFLYTKTPYELRTSLFWQPSTSWTQRPSSLSCCPTLCSCTVTSYAPHASQLLPQLAPALALPTAAQLCRSSWVASLCFRRKPCILLHLQLMALRCRHPFLYSGIVLFSRKRETSSKKLNEYNGHPIEPPLPILPIIHLFHFLPSIAIYKLSLLLLISSVSGPLSFPRSHQVPRHLSLSYDQYHSSHISHCT